MLTIAQGLSFSVHQIWMSPIVLALMSFWAGRSLIMLNRLSIPDTYDACLSIFIIMSAEYSLWDGSLSLWALLGNGWWAKWGWGSGWRLLMLLNDMHEFILNNFGCSLKLALDFWSVPKEAYLYIPMQLFKLTSIFIYGVMNFLSPLKLGVRLGLNGVIFGIWAVGFMNGVCIWVDWSSVSNLWGFICFWGVSNWSYFISVVGYIGV